MKYEDVLKVLEPCGLNCTKCLAYIERDIKQHSFELKRLLGFFDKYAERFSNFLAVFKNYPAFKDLLDYFVQTDCKGCRKLNGL